MRGLLTADWKLGISTMSVLHLQKSLVALPQRPDMADIKLRTYRGSEDLRTWLQLRAEAFRNEIPAVGPWGEVDAKRELANQSWWEPDHFWLAVDSVETDRCVATVTLASRRKDEQSIGVLHWLMVHPNWRRRGVGRYMVMQLERAAWEAGCREVRVETHAGWNAACQLYQRMGYRAI